MQDPVRQSYIVTPPRASLVSVFATSTTSTSQDLRLMGPQTVSNNVDDPGSPGHWITVICVTQGLYILFGVTAPTVDEGATGANGATCAWRLPTETPYRFWLQRGVDNFIAYKTVSGAGGIRIYQSSP